MGGVIPWEILYYGRYYAMGLGWWSGAGSLGLDGYGRMGVAGGRRFSLYIRVKIYEIFWGVGTRLHFLQSWCGFSLYIRVKIYEIFGE